MWGGAGTARLFVKAEGGIYQYVSETSPVIITALPLPPAATPAAVSAAAAVPLTVLLSWAAAAGGGGPVDGYRVEVATGSDFAPPLLFDATVPAANASLAAGPIRAAAAGDCVFARVRGFNGGGQGPAAGPAGGGCVKLVEAPPTPAELSASCLGNGWLGVGFDPAAAAAAGGLGYVVEAAAAGSQSLLATVEVPAAAVVAAASIGGSTAVALGVPHVVDLEVRARARPAGDPAAAAAAVPAAGFVRYTEPRPAYRVPLRFSVSPAAVAGAAGTTSAVLVTPDGPPRLPVTVRAASSDEAVAAVTPAVLFESGQGTAQVFALAYAVARLCCTQAPMLLSVACSSAPRRPCRRASHALLFSPNSSLFSKNSTFALFVAQVVVVFHRRRGKAVIFFAADGHMYEGLNATVVVDTLPAPA